MTSVDTVSDPDCPSAFHGTTLRVYPPDQTVALTVAVASSFCDLGVGPVHR